MRTWNERANALLDDVGRATAAARAALAVRDELRGRLRAYEAMAAALGVLEDTTVADRRREAHDVLHTAPTDVVLAEHLVTRYGEALLDARKEART